MSSETKSRVGLREAIEQVMKLYAGHGDGNPPEYGLPTLRKAWREVRTALESSSSADPGGREASNHARGAGRRQRLRELLYPKIVDDKLIADWMWREIDRIDEGLREPGADTGTTGAEGLRLLQELFEPLHKELFGLVASLNCSDHARTSVHQRVKDEIGQFFHDFLVAIQRAPVTPSEEALRENAAVDEWHTKHKLVGSNVDGWKVVERASVTDETMPFWGALKRLHEIAATSDEETGPELSEIADSFHQYVKRATPAPVTPPVPCPLCAARELLPEQRSLTAEESASLDKLYKKLYTKATPAPVATPGRDELREALSQIANALPTHLQNPASIELWAAKAKDCIRIACEVLAAAKEPR